MINKPSLVINITDSCTFHCVYCPPYGENLCPSKLEYDVNAVKTLIDVAAEEGVKLIRFTGGEPLLEFDRLYELLSYTKGRFNRTVLNTNGFLLEEHLCELEAFKDFLTIKVSLDTLDKQEFLQITGVDGYECVERALKKSVALGFMVEINTVFLNQSIDAIFDLFDFARNLCVDIKILTVSDFYGNVDIGEQARIGSLIAKIEKTYGREEDRKLATGMGASMLTYKNGNNHILIVDHSCKNSFTPNKMYFESCKTNCNFYPCDSGVLSITLSTDGILTPCRGRKDYGQKVFGKDFNTIKSAYLKALKYFESCCHINVNNPKD